VNSVNGLTVEQSRSLFQTEALGFDDEEVTEGGLEGKPTAVDDVVLPTDHAKSDRVDVLVEDEGDDDDKAEQCEALRTERVGEDLESVGYDQGRECDIVRGVKQEDEGDDRMGSRFAPGNGVTSGAHGLENEEQQHANARRDEKDPSSDTFCERGSSNSPSKVPDLEDTVDEELDGRIGDANGLEYFVEIVRDEAISGPLREPSNGDDD